MNITAEQLLEVFADYNSQIWQCKSWPMSAGLVALLLIYQAN